MRTDCTLLFLCAQSLVRQQAGCENNLFRSESKFSLEVAWKLSYIQQQRDSSVFSRVNRERNSHHPEALQVTELVELIQVTASGCHPNIIPRHR